MVVILTIIIIIITIIMMTIKINGNTKILSVL